jgi:hypothetical protein
MDREYYIEWFSVRRHWYSVRRTYWWRVMHVNTNVLLVSQATYNTKQAMLDSAQHYANKFGLEIHEGVL